MVVEIELWTDRFNFCRIPLLPTVFGRLDQPAFNLDRCVVGNGGHLADDEFNVASAGFCLDCLVDSELKELACWAQSAIKYRASPAAAVSAAAAIWTLLLHTSRLRVLSTDARLLRIKTPATIDACVTRSGRNLIKALSILNLQHDETEATGSLCWMSSAVWSCGCNERSIV